MCEIASVSRTALSWAILTIAVAVATVVASYLYLWAAASGQGGMADGIPPPRTIAVFWIWIVASLACALAVPYAVTVLIKNKALRTPGNLLVTGTGALLLLSAVAYALTMLA